MCGRFTLAVDTEELRKSFPWLEVGGEVRARYNIAPSQPVAVVPNDGRKRLDFFVWGLIPSWAKDPKIGYKMINARGETIHEKPTFRAAFRRRRCLILADGFYEWHKRKVEGRQVSTPMYIHLNSREPFAFAGLWETWYSPLGDELRTCTIITTTPNEFVAGYHDRMPVILHPEDYDEWLDPAERAPDQLRHLIRSYPAEAMAAYPVSPLVNSPQNEVPECAVPAGG